LRLTKGHIIRRKLVKKKPVTETKEITEEVVTEKVDVSDGQR
jgi:hypothetical protein